MRQSYLSHRNSLLELRARQMRTALTPPEQALWQRINRRQLGTSFRRQFRIGRFIVDFAAPSARLVVEVDGAHHRLQRAADARRDAKLAPGYRVLRFQAGVVIAQLGAVVAAIRAALS